MWYIMSYNAYRLAVADQRPDFDVFFSGKNGLTCSWVETISEAKSYPTKDMAVAEAERIWGKQFAQDTFMIVQFNGQDNNGWVSAHIRRRQALGARLASRDISVNELTVMAYGDDNGLTHREKMIIKRLTQRPRVVSSARRNQEKKSMYEVFRTESLIQLLARSENAGSMRVVATFRCDGIKDADEIEQKALEIRDVLNAAVA